MTQQEALDIMLSGQNCFLTGEAGSGKTWLTQEYIRLLRQDSKTVIVTAPTGVAAINIWWATLHSTFRVFGMYPTKRTVRSQKISWTQVDAIIIDEISMVGPDILDQIDHVLRSCAKWHQPFWGIQVILVWDAGQLKPVYAPHTPQDMEDYRAVSARYNGKLTFDSATAYVDWWFTRLHLTEPQRQKDPEFLERINLIRAGKASTALKFNQWCWDADSVHLMPTNDMVNNYNEVKYYNLDAVERKYKGKIDGDFNIKNAITPVELLLKVWARIMITKNDNNTGIVNGDAWYVKNFSTEWVNVYLDRFPWQTILVAPSVWQQIEYIGSEEIVIGTYTQIPLKLAWAITIHKSQWLTLDNVCVHVTKGMKHDLLYVAVSRASSQEKLFINRR